LARPPDRFFINIDHRHAGIGWSLPWRDALIRIEYQSLGALEGHRVAGRQHHHHRQRGEPR
jgi:hypothetical protein